ncbi:MAG TPA: GNAT family N-acetyltransferase [Opitutaceae bacterium]|nr:GNAT family N-acetyltransferase [Opitutaceae bacterium]
MDGVRIERSRPEDAPELTRIAFGAKRHWGYPESWIQRWRDVLTVTPEFVRENPTYCAIKGGKMIGFCALRLGGDEATVDHLWVLPAAAGEGVGASLYLRCEERAREAGASRLKVESDPHAEGFYQKMGAVAVGRRPAPMDCAERFLPLLEKTLA